MVVLLVFAVRIVGASMGWMGYEGNAPGFALCYYTPANI